MKIDRLIWGILFLFVGGVLLLDNFDVITFYWRNVWQFWPVILIIGGINVLLGRKESNTGSIITLVVLLVTLGYLFYRGQQPPEHRGWFSKDFHTRFDFDDDDNNDDSDSGKNQGTHFSEPFNDHAKNAVLNIYCGGTSLELKGETDSLVKGYVTKRFGSFNFEKIITDSTYNFTLRMQEKRGSFTLSNNHSNAVDLYMNTSPKWDVNMHMGAGDIDLDLSRYKIGNLNFDGGAAAVDIKMGSLLPVANVTVKTGVADVKIHVPVGAGCQIRTNTGLSSKDFDGFEKVSDGLYETSNFRSAKNTIYLKLDGGLSNFEVNRY